MQTDKTYANGKNQLHHLKHRKCFPHLLVLCLFALLSNGGPTSPVCRKEMGANAQSEIKVPPTYRPGFHPTPPFLTPIVSFSPFSGLLIITFPSRWKPMRYQSFISSKVGRLGVSQLMP